VHEQTVRKGNGRVVDPLATRLNGTQLVNDFARVDQCILGQLRFFPENGGGAQENGRGWIGRLAQRLSFFFLSQPAVAVLLRRGDSVGTTRGSKLTAHRMRLRHGEPNDADPPVVLLGQCSAIFATRILTVHISVIFLLIVVVIVLPRLTQSTAPTRSEQKANQIAHHNNVIAPQRSGLPPSGIRGVVVKAQKERNGDTQSGKGRKGVVDGLARPFAQVTAVNDFGKSSNSGSSYYFGCNGRDD